MTEHKKGEFPKMMKKNWNIQKSRNIQKLFSRLPDGLTSILEFRLQSEQSLRSRAIRLLAAFLAIMAVFTFLSRSADSLTVPKVQVDAPEARVIEHRISAAGTAMENRETAVSVEAGLQVESVYVSMGDTVKKGDVLLKMNLEQLQEKIDEVEKEIESLRLSNEALSYNKSLQESSRSKSIRQAEKNYADAKSAGSDAVSAAKKELEQARRDLKQAQKEKKKSKKKESQNEGNTENKASTDQDGSDENNGGQSDAGSTGEGGVSDTGGNDDGGQSGAADIESLKSLVEEKEQAYEEAKNSQKSALSEAQQAINEAKAPLEKDNTDAINDLSIDTYEKNLSKLNELKAAKGQIKADKDGVITNVAVSAGSMTTEEAAMRMADLSAGIRFVAQFSKEEEKYLSDDAEVSLSLDGETPVAEGLSLESVTESGGGETAVDSDTLDASVLLTGDTLTNSGLSIGQTATMIVTQKSEKYATTIPLSALREENNKEYILTVEKRDSVLGEEWFAQRTEVTVLDKNETYAAIKEGVINADSTVIISSSRSVDDGDRVREEEETS